MTLYCPDEVLNKTASESLAVKTVPHRPAPTNGLRSIRAAPATSGSSIAALIAFISSIAPSAARAARSRPARALPWPPATPTRKASPIRRLAAAGRPTMWHCCRSSTIICRAAGGSGGSGPGIFELCNSVPGSSLGPHIPEAPASSAGCPRTRGWSLAGGRSQGGPWERDQNSATSKLTLRVTLPHPAFGRVAKCNNTTGSGPAGCRPQSVVSILT